MPAKTFPLTKRELERYDRQIRIPGIGVKGQKKLREAHVVVAGLGGLGCPASMYLAAAGVGRLTLIDAETIELSNLNRQVLHWEADIGRFKADSAAEKLKKLNPEVWVEAVREVITEDNATQLFKGADIVVDGMDNFKARFAINKACVELGIPFVHAAVYGMEVRVMTIVPGEGPCLRCLLPLDPPEMKSFPVLGAAPALAASLQVMEAIKLITGIGTPLIGRMVVVDGFDMRFFEMAVEKRPDCSVCKGA